jgi:predicted enzyme related to lactoylglutathione lyase
MITLADTALLVRDHDEAIAFYVGILGFSLLEDRWIGARRWVRIKAGTAGLVLRQASHPAQAARVGDQTGQSVLLFLETADFAATYATLKARGVRFVEEPRDEDYGTVAVFLDPYGNKLDLIEPREQRSR